MTRRKGERPVSRPLDRWSLYHPVARMIASGDRWFSAWTMQQATPLGRLSEQTGISLARLLTIERDDTGAVSLAELDALACAWNTSAGDIRALMPPTVQIVA